MGTVFELLIQRALSLHDSESLCFIQWDQSSRTAFNLAELFWTALT